MDLLVNLFGSAAVARVGTYMARARWRAGPLGSRTPRTPRQLPDLDPVIDAFGSRSERRSVRAARIASRRR